MAPSPSPQPDPQPAQWWPNQRLDVTGLAKESVERARAAVQSLADSRGLTISVTTSDELTAASFAAIEHLVVDDTQVQGWAAYSGFFATSDGWVRLHGNYPHHSAAIERGLGVSGREQLADLLATLPSGGAVERIGAEGGIAVQVNTAEHWASSTPGRATAADPWWLTTEGAERAPLATGAHPLDGIRVLDLTRVIAGPTCSQLLACLGADVLRIDPPTRPELLEQYLSNGMGKRSTELDLNEPWARDRVHHLLAQADVVLLGYRPGSLERFGMRPAELAERHSTLVIGELSAWGDHGPWGQRSGFDSIVQAASGIALLYGDDERPGALPVQALDHATGYHLAAEALGLLARGRGGRIRISLLGAARELLSRPIDPGPDRHVRELVVPKVTLESPNGRLSAVPPPLLIDGATIEAPVGGYAASDAEWLPRN